MSLMIPPFTKLGSAAALGGGDATAPTLTFPVALPLGDTSAHLAVTTDEGNGTLYYVITTAVTSPSAAQVKAGQDHTGASASYAGSQAVSSTGNKTATGTGLSSNTTYYGHFMHEDAAANQSAVKSQTVFTTLTTGTSDTSFDNLIAAASVAPSDLRKGYVARFIGALYTAGVWSKMDVMWVLAAHDEQFGRLNWITPGTYTCTAVNSPTFTTDRGFAGNGSTSYLDTNFAPSTNAVQFAQNNAHISLYVRSTQNGNEPFSLANASFRISVQAGATNTARAKMNSGTQVLAPTSPSTAVPNQAIGRRNDATNVSILRDGLEVTAPTAAASASIQSGNMDFGRRGGSTYSTTAMAGGTLGAYLDDTEALAFYSAWNAYMVALGADT